MYRSMIQESLESRRFLSVNPATLVDALSHEQVSTNVLDASANSSVYAPHAVVAGQTIQEWAADWWSLVFETPVHDAGGTTVTHPNLDETGQYGGAGDVGDVFFLFQTIFGGEVNRSVTVPAGKPILAPVLPMEFSNYDTADPDGNFPAQYTAAELQGFASASAKSVITRGEMHASIDGEPIQGLQAHRERSPVSYTLPAEDNLLQFFGLPFSGPVSPAAVDGFFFMIKPLSPGQHTLRFGGTIPENPAPLLSNFSVEMVYNITVEAPARSSPTAQPGLFAERQVALSAVADDGDRLEALSADVLT